MDKIEPRTLPGFMELLPNEQILFNEMKEKITKSYEKFGFLPIDTPIIEMSEVLLAKAGGETEKQIYRFNKGDNDLSLRFDLTVPLAKYVAQNYNNLAFPFNIFLLFMHIVKLLKPNSFIVVYITAGIWASFTIFSFPSPIISISH